MNVSFWKPATFVFAFVLLLAGCDSTSPEEETPDTLGTNSFELNLNDNQDTQSHKGDATASIKDFTNPSVDSALVTSKVLELYLKMNDSPETYFALRRNGENLDELKQTGTYNLAVAENELESEDGFQGEYIEWQSARRYESAVCRTGSVTIATFTDTQITGSFTCTSPNRTLIDNASNEHTVINEPISLEGNFVVGTAFSND